MRRDLPARLRIALQAGRRRTSCASHMKQSRLCRLIRAAPNLMPTIFIRSEPICHFINAITAGLIIVWLVSHEL